MSKCPECDAIQQRIYETGLRVTNLEALTPRLRQQLQDGLKGPAEVLRHCTGIRLRAEAEHAAAARAVADLVLQTSAMTGGAAAPTASMIGSDVSLTPQDGWIERQMGSQTFWFRTEQAIEQFNRASGLQGLLDALAAARNRESLLRRDVQNANQQESDAQGALDRAVD